MAVVVLDSLDMAGRMVVNNVNFTFVRAEVCKQLNLIAGISCITGTLVGGEDFGIRRLHAFA